MNGLIRQTIWKEEYPKIAIFIVKLKVHVNEINSYLRNKRLSWMIQAVKTDKKQIYMLNLLMYCFKQNKCAEAACLNEGVY